MSIYDLSSGRFVKTLPIEIGSIDSLTGRKKDQEMFFKLSSFLNPGVTYRFDFQTQDLSVFRQTKLNIDNFDLNNYETKQVFYESKDGTKIPMFIISKKVHLLFLFKQSFNPNRILNWTVVTPLYFMDTAVSPSPSLLLSAQLGWLSFDTWEAWLPLQTFVAVVNMVRNGIKLAV